MFETLKDFAKKGKYKEKPEKRSNIDTRTNVKPKVEEDTVWKLPNPPDFYGPSLDEL